jgi:hypothetical protein
MMRNKITFDTVRRIGMGLPDVEESTTYGVTSLKVGGQLLTCPAINKSAEPGSIVVRVPIDQRDELIAEAPEIYYVTDHYVNYPSVLVRLSRIDAEALRGLLRMSWQYVTSKKPARKKKPRMTRSARIRP